jgi:hypothetical protein
MLLTPAMWAVSTLCSTIEDSWRDCLAVLGSETLLLASVRALWSDKNLEQPLLKHIPEVAILEEEFNSFLSKADYVV